MAHKHSAQRDTTAFGVDVMDTQPTPPAEWQSNDGC